VGNLEKAESQMKGETNIEGTLLMLDDSTPHVAVPVQAICDGKVIATTLSDESGKYQFANLKPSQYQLRCQVLGGYVYYGEERARKPEGQKAGKPKDGIVPDESISLSTHKPISLRVEQGETLKDIDFRFAPFKKGTWRSYTSLHGLVHDEVTVIYRDHEGVMWFGSERNRSVRRSVPSWISYPHWGSLRKQESGVVQLV